MINSKEFQQSLKNKHNINSRLTLININYSKLKLININSKMLINVN